MTQNIKFELITSIKELDTDSLFGNGRVENLAILQLVH